MRWPPRDPRAAVRHHQAGNRGPGLPVRAGCHQGQPRTAGPCLRGPVSHPLAGGAERQVHRRMGRVMRSPADGLTKSIGVVELHAGAPVEHHRPSLLHPGGQPDRAASAAEPGRTAGRARRAFDPHRGLQPARRGQAAGEPGDHDGGGGARQVAGAGADPLEPAAGQRGDPPLVEPGAHRRERRGLRLRIDARADGRLNGLDDGTRFRRTRRPTPAPSPPDSSMRPRAARPPTPGRPAARTRGVRR